MFATLATRDEQSRIMVSPNLHGKLALVLEDAQGKKMPYQFGSETTATIDSRKLNSFTYTARLQNLSR